MTIAETPAARTNETTGGQAIGAAFAAARSDGRAALIPYVVAGYPDADASLENEPGCLFDALVLPDGEEAVAGLAQDGHTMEFIRDQYRHCKAILVLGASTQLTAKAGLPVAMDKSQAQGRTGIVFADAAQAGGAAEAE